MEVHDKNLETLANLSVENLSENFLRPIISLVDIAVKYFKNPDRPDKKDLELAEDIMMVIQPRNT